MKRQLATINGFAAIVCGLCDEPMARMIAERMPSAI